MMTLEINGELVDVTLRSAESLRDLLVFLGQKSDQVIVEINGELYRESAFDEVILKPLDRIEILHFIGGGL